MKTNRILLPLLLLWLIAGSASAQMSLVVFSEKGEKFTAYLDGSRAGEGAYTRVETERPMGPSFKLRIRFEDTSLPEISKTVFNSPGPEMFYVIRKNEKGKFILEKSASEYVRHETGTEKKAEPEQVKESEKPAVTDASGGKKGCTGPMELPDFYASREMISNAPFDGPKLTQAKNLADRKCLTAFQITEMMSLFSGEGSRLAFAKHAYKHCFDPDNYDVVKNELRTASRDDLQRYIDSLK